MAIVQPPLRDGLSIGIAAADREHALASPILAIRATTTARLSELRLTAIRRISSRFSCAPKDSVVIKEEPVPLPIVHIDQESDPHVTIVELSYGDRLGALLDTMKALKDLGLNVVKGSVAVSGKTKSNRLSITRAATGRKVEDPELLESIRLTIISNLLQYHPESSEKLAMGEAFGKKPPKKIDVKTHITVTDQGPARSLLTIETADKPGLLLDIVEMITATSVTVESAEIDTEGLVARDRFHVSYGGAALTKSLAEVLVNCLRFHLRRSESEDESY
ncbi:ACT domain-containing protein ACR12 [Selaginella moellendorffii]|uniref:ACT domain-containing protein ACR12 n=1 Tax=Selaginella moellendorffii TaxID=88036 RepID=UPI000D1C5755|nr:ACT domain-containing protein ACR12 [Selaginella moellendorffii]XP_024545034.1 ACT domain-containing protein ACR12 [Selaginella moellendorffii]|eukprot:XP_002984308.2 ACT domain-containing protein ACR12 [Selaginella moellendorffii]